MRRAPRGIENPLAELQRIGQSPWYDGLHRGLLRSGTLARLIREGQISGLTATPSAFAWALAHTLDYDDALQKLVAAGRPPDAILASLVIDDVRAAAQLFAPVYERTKARDGYVGLQLPPSLADDAEGTLREAKHLWKAVKAPNLLLGIPATDAGLSALEECIAAGINVNATLVFGLRRHGDVMDAYLRGLSRRSEAGTAIDRLCSVASFLVDRMDVEIDRLLDERIALAGIEERVLLERLKGKGAIADAKLAYAACRDRFGADDFAHLAPAGARRQRPLWVVGAPSDPGHPDVYYVEALIGPATVCAMPPETLAAYADHGHPEDRADAALDRARAVFAQLADAGIDLDEVGSRLERDGVAAAREAHERLLEMVTMRREALRVGARDSTRLGPLERAVSTSLRTLTKGGGGDGLGSEPTTGPGTPGSMAGVTILEPACPPGEPPLAELAAFADELRNGGFTHVVAFGEGAALPAADALRRVLGVARGFLDVTVLDSTDPTTVASAVRGDPARTLHLVVASSTTDHLGTDAVLRFLWERAEVAGGEQAGDHFVAITPPETPLAQLATERRFRRTFLDPASPEARPGALSHAVLVPAALLGVDLSRLLERARRMRAACGPAVPIAHNPGLHLGAVLAAAARSGRDKCTIVVPERLHGLAAWAAYVLAERTAGAQTPLVPVIGEPLGPPTLYGKDRVFLHLRLGAKQDRPLTALARAGHPVVTAALGDAYDVAAELVRIEVAAAAAATLLQARSPSDPERDTGEAPLRALLAHPEGPAAPSASSDAIAVGTDDFPARLMACLTGARGRRHVALHAYFAPSPRRARLLAEVRVAIRKRCGVATTLTYGPRLQDPGPPPPAGGRSDTIRLHLTADRGTDVAVPGCPYTLGRLAAAQAAAARDAQRAARRPVLELALGRTVDAGLQAVVLALSRPLRRAPARPQKAGSARARAGSRR